MKMTRNQLILALDAACSICTSYVDFIPENIRNTITLLEKEIDQYYTDNINTTFKGFCKEQRKAVDLLAKSPEHYEREAHDWNKK